MVVGARLHDRYRLDRRLASGGMGTVYEAHDERLRRKIAVKLLKEELAGDPRFVARFRREARAVASLAHPAIANVYDFGEDGGTYFIVMQFAEGDDLARLLQREGPLEPARAATIARGVCAALAHAHVAGIVHRDVKPGNIMVGPADSVTVTDFGIARAVGDATMTDTGTILGSAHYLSPEQASGAEVGPASDIYSLGVVLFEMLTGRVPFGGDTPVAIAMRHVSEDLPAPSAVNPSVPPAYDEVVGRATAKDPSARFPDADAFAAALARASRGEAATTAVAAAPVAEASVWPAPADGWDLRRAGRAGLFALAAVAALAAGLLLIRAMGGDEARREERPRAPGGGETTEASPTSTPTPSPEQLVVPEGIVGMHFDDAKGVLEDAGLTVEREDVESDAERDIVVGSDPDPGSPVEPEQQITLFVSTGPPEEDDEGDDAEEGDDTGGRGPPEVPPGQEKKEEDDG